MKLCSACLLGINCRYDGRSALNEKVVELSKKEKLLPVCPEVLGGLTVPREEAEIKNGGVITKSGKDVTSFFEKGANEVLRIAQSFDIKEIILKQRSPSCGCGEIHDGTFSGKIIKGDGIAAALLKKNGIKIISEEDL